MFSDSESEDIVDTDEDSTTNRPAVHALLQMKQVGPHPFLLYATTSPSSFTHPTFNIFGTCHLHRFSFLLNYCTCAFLAICCREATHPLPGQAGLPTGRQEGVFLRGSGRQNQKH